MEGRGLSCILVFWKCEYISRYYFKLVFSKLASYVLKHSGSLRVFTLSNLLMFMWLLYQDRYCSWLQGTRDDCYGCYDQKLGNDPNLWDLVFHVEVVAFWCVAGIHKAASPLVVLHGVPSLNDPSSVFGGTPSWTKQQGKSWFSLASLPHLLVYQQAVHHLLYYFQFGGKVNLPRQPSI